MTDTEWHIVFYISAGIYLIGCAFYAVAASGERQPWAQPNKPMPNINTADEQGPVAKREDNLDITLDTVVSNTSEAESSTK